MTYEVKVTQQAEAEAELAYQWLAKESPEKAVAWFNGLVEAVEALEALPERCPLAPESSVVQRDIRQLLEIETLVALRRRRAARPRPRRRRPA